jgi:PAS domain-containing protein
MIAIRKSLFILLILISIASVLGMGIASYLLLEQNRLSSLEPDQALVLKLQAEAILFSSIISVSVLVLLLIFIGINMQKTLKGLDALFAGRLDRNDPGEWKRLLGALGPRFLENNKLLIELSRRRRTKIRGLSALTEFLVLNAEAPLVAVNIKGTVVYASPEFCEKLELNASEIITNNITKLLFGIKMTVLVSTVDRNHQDFELETKTGKIHVYPIIEKQSDLAYFVISLTGRVLKLRGSAIEQQNRNKEEASSLSIASRIRKSFTRFFNN